MSRPLLFAAVAWAAALVACDEKKAPPVAVQSALADSADQVMFGARSLLTDRGLLRAELRADTAFFFDDNTRIEMRIVHTTFHTMTGAKNAVLTAREGTYSTRAGGMEARGKVLVVSEDGRRLVTEQLRFDEARNEISSDSAFVLTEPGRRVEGIGFVSDPDMNNVRILKTTRSNLGPITPPGQTP